MAVLGVMVIPALMLEFSADPGVQSLGAVLNWGIWLAFCAELGIRLWMAPRRLHLLRRSWFDVALIVLTPPFVSDALQGARTLRIVRMVRVVRAGAVLVLVLRRLRLALVHRGFHYVAMVGVATVVVGAVAIFALEGGVNPNIKSMDDALWWAIVTTTTVGYGDISPTSGEGRAVAVLLMVVGIGVIGAFTATIASFLMEHQQAAQPSVDERLARVEAMLAELLEAQRREQR